MNTELIPRFKKGQEIEYNPTQSVNFKKRPVWEIYGMSVPHQKYWLRRFDGNQSRKRALPFKDQRKYRVVGLSFEDQPPKYPTDNNQTT